MPGVIGMSCSVARNLSMLGGKSIQFVDVVVVVDQGQCKEYDQMRVEISVCVCFCQGSRLIETVFQ